MNLTNVGNACAYLVFYQSATTEPSEFGLIGMNTKRETDEAIRQLEEDGYITWLYCRVPLAPNVADFYPPELASLLKDYQSKQSGG